MLCPGNKPTCDDPNRVYPSAMAQQANTKTEQWKHLKLFFKNVACSNKWQERSCRSFREAYFSINKHVECSVQPNRLNVKFTQIYRHTKHIKEQWLPLISSWPDFVVLPVFILKPLSWLDLASHKGANHPKIRVQSLPTYPHPDAWVGFTANQHCSSIFNSWSRWNIKWLDEARPV